MMAFWRKFIETTSMTSGQKEIFKIYFMLVLMTSCCILFIISHTRPRTTVVIQKIITNRNITSGPAPVIDLSVNFTDPHGRVTSLLKPETAYVVPNIVHYVWFGENEMFTFHHYLGVKSAFLFVKPEKVMFHCDFKPIGKWWTNLMNLIESRAYQYGWNFQVVHRVPRTTIFNKEITRIRHKVDIAAIEILQLQGGIYIDLDVVALKSFNPLRLYNFTMGLEYFGDPGRLNNGVILSRKNSQFLSLWLNSYKDFVKSEWDRHSAQVPYELQFKHPELIHVEQRSINRPNGKEMDLIYQKHYDWSRNYAMHFWEELYDFEHNPESIKKMNTTFGEIARKIYYDENLM